jgi:hypothetical protein
MTTTEAQQFIEKLRELETFADEHPDLLGNRDSGTNMTEFLDHALRTTRERVTAFNRLSAGEKFNSVAHDIGIINVMAASEALAERLAERTL